MKFSSKNKNSGESSIEVRAETLPSPQKGESHQWKRASPLALGYFLFDTLRHIINLWPVILGVWAGGDYIQTLFFKYGIFLVCGLIVLSMVLDYWFYSFQISQDSIQVKRGYVTRKRLTLYFDRVQQADISQPIYFRPFGLAILVLESAGSTKQEVNIPGLRLLEAEQLKSKILDFQAEYILKNEDNKLPNFNKDLTPTLNDRDFELRLGVGEVARYGVMNNGLIFILPIMGPLMDRLTDNLSSYSILIQDSFIYQFLQTIKSDQLLVVLVFIAIGFVLIGFLILTSVIFSIVRYWKYHLIQVGDKFQYQCGLFTLKSRGFRLHKLQKITVKQGLFARCLKRYTISISKAGTIGGTNNGENKYFLVPVVSKNSLQSLMKQLNINPHNWCRVDIFQLFWSGGQLALLLSIGSYFLMLKNIDSVWICLFIALSIFIVILLLTIRFWYGFGYDVGDDWVAIKSSLLGKKINYIPTVKIQKIQLNERPWLQPRGLIHVYIWSGDGKLTIPYVPAQIAVSIRDKLLDRVATYKGRWF